VGAARRSTAATATPVREDIAFEGEVISPHEIESAVCMVVGRSGYKIETSPSGRAARNAPLQETASLRGTGDPRFDLHLRGPE
jgi:hypothetical protein